MMPALFATATFLSTMLGGACAMRYRNRLHLLMGFAAGVLLGVVSFDIFPEIITQVKVNAFDPQGIMIAMVSGFLIFHVFEKLLVIHHANESQYAEHKHPLVGLIGASGLAFHSFLDGVGIGLGFQVSVHVGFLISLAVIAHDFSDGLNTVCLMLMHKNTQRRSVALLVVGATAPVLGAASTYLFTIPAQWLILYLGFFAGFLFYIGASDLLPEAHSTHSSLKLVGLTMLGSLFIFLVTRFA